MRPCDVDKGQSTRSAELNHSMQMGIAAHLDKVSHGCISCSLRECSESSVFLSVSACISGRRLVLPNLLGNFWISVKLVDTVIWQDLFVSQQSGIDKQDYIRGPLGTYFRNSSNDLFEKTILSLNVSIIPTERTVASTHLSQLS